MSRRTRRNAGFFVIGAPAIFLNLRGGRFERGIFIRLILTLDWIGLVLSAMKSSGASADVFESELIENAMVVHLKSQALEIPTPAWPAYDAKFFGSEIPDTVAMWTSPDCETPRTFKMRLVQTPRG